jgi:hypothetical protein
MTIIDKPRRAEIGLGDLLRALDQLKPETHSQTGDILRCLGFQTTAVYRLPQPYRSSQGAWNRTRFRKITQQKPSTKFSPKPSLPPTPEPPIELPKDVLPSELETLPDASTMAHTTEPDSDIENAPVLSLEGDQPTPPPRFSLFPKQRARAITSMTIAQCTEGRDIDILRLIDVAVQRRIIRSIPKLPQTTIRNGCHLLLDFSDALMPWWEDMRDLMHQFQSLLDPYLCKSFEFEDDPMMANHWSETKGDVSWQPEQRKPVVVATDLGVVRHPSLGLRPDPSAWVRLAQYCHRVEAPLIAIVPIHPQRWPKGLDRWLRIIHWNPATSAATVKRLLNHRVAPK